MKSVLLVAILAGASPALAAPPVTGRWMTADKDSIIEIAPCGKRVCGRVARVIKRNPDGTMPRDANNPDPALRRRAVEGMTILSDFTPAGSVWQGRIYDPRSGRSYKSKLARNADGSLNVQGCVAFFCRSFRWTAAS